MLLWIFIYAAVEGVVRLLPDVHRSPAVLQHLAQHEQRVARLALAVEDRAAAVREVCVGADIMKKLGNPGTVMPR